MGTWWSSGQALRLEARSDYEIWSTVMSDLIPLRTACVPREDVLQGGLADNHFAAQLDKVVRDAEHYSVYGDAEAFFAQTYPTSGLKTLLTKTFGRVTAATRSEERRVGQVCQVMLL